MIVIAIALFVVAVVIVATTVAAAVGLLKVNPIAGIRIPAVMQSEEAWEAGHLAALLPMTVGGVIAVAGGFVCLLRPGSWVVLIVTVLLLIASLLFAVVRAGWAGRNAG
ncbi:hypothetical protein AX769_03015 [Frondihabitans sp. PAMC 28766]|uniref:SdpI family protein n=1 Tax=Frondihabitans sp. PAMC 28766 TaxID=1795630 RepID=UPI00078CDA30|nr:SdpI family protein [Frondihabitans sp. PAMC 28766]AMM19290.1 hypothetical protein AX769_03015 [Frondihabitans sp. PAMC 28766]